MDERYFDPAEKIIREFEKMKGINIDDIDTTRHEGKRLRGELLVYLKENAGLKYKEIGEFDIFGGLSFVSLRSNYRNMKKNHLKTEGLRG